MTRSLFCYLNLPGLIICSCSSNLTDIFECRRFTPEGAISTISGMAAILLL